MTLRYIPAFSVPFLHQDQVCFPVIVFVADQARLNQLFFAPAVEGFITNFEQALGVTVVQQLLINRLNRNRHAMHGCFDVFKFGKDFS